MGEKNAKGEIRRHTILAHELGHSLGLAHTNLSDQDCNLMTTGDCGQSNIEHTDSEGLLIKKLNDCQVEIIRHTTETKSPAASMSQECDDE